jgi:NPCBM/NEW2 domain
VRIPSETIAGILMTVPLNPLERSRWFAQVFARRPQSDVVFLQNGDRAAGDLLSFDQANLKLAQGGKPLQIETARIRGIAFNAGLSSLPAGKKPRLQVMLTDGSQLTGFGASRERGGPLRFTTVVGSPLEIPLAAVSSIRFLDGRTTYLSDLDPVLSHVTGFFGSPARVAPARNRNVLGGPLVVRGTEYPKGLGTRSQSRIEFELAGHYRRFQALAALDDLAGRKGCARFVVERDGARLFESGLVTGADAPRAVGPFDVTGAHRLVLIVDYGELADINDWADWCDALVIR